MIFILNLETSKSPPFLEAICFRVCRAVLLYLVLVLVLKLYLSTFFRYWYWYLYCMQSTGTCTGTWIFSTGTDTGTCNKVLVAKKKIFWCCWDAAGVATSQPKPTKNYGAHCSRLGLTDIWRWTMTMMTARPSSPTSPRGSCEEVNDVTRKLRGTGPCGIWP